MRRKEYEHFHAGDVMLNARDMHFRAGDVMLCLAKCAK